MRYMLDTIALAMRKVVHWIDAPRIAGAVVVGMLNAVQHRVSHQHVGMCHIYFSAKGFAAVRKLARLHTAKQVQVLVNTAVTVGTINAGLGRRSFLSSNFFRRRIIYVSQPF